MKLKRGLSRIWAYLYRVKLARPHMPFWRVVVEARLDRRAKNWPKRFDTAVAPVYVWARTIEEAEGLAARGLRVRPRRFQPRRRGGQPSRTCSRVAGTARRWRLPSREPSSTRPEQN